MKARETKPAPSADLLVCFPPRSHLTLMPKPICSPARPSEPNKRRHRHHHLKKVATRGGGPGQASPLLWARNKQMGSEIAEPTSPKVTCAGQIKVRPRPGNCKSWQSVMEEIERIHNKNKKKPSWVESLGFKKDILQFLACLRSIRFDFRCFGSFTHSDVCTDNDDDGEEELYGHNNHAVGDSDEKSRAIFSKWFMVLQENQSDGSCKEERGEKQRTLENDPIPAVPPPNALLLMRCRSAPAKSWTEETEEIGDEDEEREKEQEEVKDEKCRERKSRNLRSLMDEEKENRKGNSVMTRYGKISTEVWKETWVVGETRDPLSRSRSWKR